MKRHQWPKIIPPLTAEQEAISHDFMQVWLQTLQKKYGLIENFNHGYPARHAVIPPGCRTLEIGAGIGGHLHYENLKIQDYYCVDLRDNVVEELKRVFPQVKASVGDCQKRLEFPDKFFNRIVAIHILEHLPNLPLAITEMRRLLADDGTIDVVIPCDPGFLYSLARKISAERLFRKRYGQDYNWFISREHINSPDEIITLLREQFHITRSRYFPFIIPIKSFNLCFGMQLCKK